MACSKIGHTCGCSGGCSGCSGTCTCSGGCSCGSGCTCGSNCSGTCSSTCSGGCKATCADSCENTCTSACKNFKRYSGGSWIGVDKVEKASRAIHMTDTAVVCDKMWTTSSSSSHGHYVSVYHSACSVLELAMTAFAYVMGYGNKDSAYNYIYHCINVNNIDRNIDEEHMLFSRFAVDVLVCGQTSYNPNYGTLKEHFYKSSQGYNYFFNSNGDYIRGTTMPLYGQFRTKEAYQARTVTQVKAYKNGSWVGLGYKE